MITPDELAIMTEGEKLSFLRSVAELESWQESFTPLYERLIEDESPKVREEAVAGFWDIADPGHIALLTRKAENDPSVQVRAKAVSVLGIYIYEGVVNMNLDEKDLITVRRFLLDTANDPDEDVLVRRMAIEALSFDADDEVHALIEWAYEHSEIEVRMSALFSMGRSQSARWYDTILAEMDSKDKRIRLEAANAAGEAQLREATAKLRVLAGHSDRELALAAIWALSRTRGPGALETLEMCQQSKDEEISRVARMAIEEYWHAAEFDEDQPLTDYRDYEED